MTYKNKTLLRKSFKHFHSGQAAIEYVVLASMIVLIFSVSEIDKMPVFEYLADRIAFLLKNFSFVISLPL